MRLSTLRGTILSRVSSGERDEERLISETVGLIEDEGLTVAVLQSWASHLVRDCLARVVQPATRRLPRAPFVSEGQVPSPWAEIAAPEFPQTAHRYIAKYGPIVQRVAFLRRVLEVLEPWLAENDGSGMTTVEAARLAGVAEDDLLALTA